MATVYAQTVFDIGLGAYVRYTQQLVTANPDPATTTPVGVGPFNAATHRILQQIESHNPQTWFTVPTVGDLPMNSAVLVGDICWVQGTSTQYTWNGASWEVTGGGPVSPVKFTGALQQVLSVPAETLLGSIGAFDPGTFATPVINFEATFVFAPATAGTVEIRLYDVGTRAAPTAGVLRSTITATIADAGIRKCVSNVLTAVAAPGVNTDEVYEGERVYEVRAELLGTNPGDILAVENASVVVVGSSGAGGGVLAPATAQYLTLAAAPGLTQERVISPANSVRGVDGGPNSPYTLDLVGDIAAPGANMQYATNGAGVRGWYAIAGGGGGKQAQKFIVGNAGQGDTLGICDFLDPGDGSGIEAALLAAAAGGDVYIRPGFYGPGLTPPFNVPGGCIVWGAHWSQVVITGSPTARQVFFLNPYALIKSMSIYAPTGTTGAMAGTEIVYSGNASMEDVYIDASAVDTTDATETLTRAVFADTAFGGTTGMQHCYIYGVRGSDQPGPVMVLRGIYLSSAGNPYYVRDTRFDSFDDALFISGGARHSVTGCNLSNIARYGVIVAGASRCLIQGNTIELNTTTWPGTANSISVSGVSGRNRILGNEIQQDVLSGYAIDVNTTTVNASGTNIINDNVVEDVTGGNAILLGATEAGSVVRGNSTRGGVITNLGIMNEVGGNNTYVTP